LRVSMIIFHAPATLQITTVFLHDALPISDLYSVSLAMYEVLENGGIAPGGINFDAKVRRTSFEMEDSFIAHIAGMDTFARGLKRSEEHTSELQSRFDLVCPLLLDKTKKYA